MSFCCYYYYCYLFVLGENTNQVSLNYMKYTPLTLSLVQEMERLVILLEYFDTNNLTTCHEFTVNNKI